jgi:hypothetical protein
MRRLSGALLLGALWSVSCGDATSDVITRRAGACRDNGGCTHPDTPICDEVAGVCVECISDGHCNVIGERCSNVLRECAVPCTTSDECPSDDRICDGAVGFCVECMTDEDCGLHQPYCRDSECKTSS